MVLFSIDDRFNFKSILAMTYMWTFLKSSVYITFTLFKKVEKVCGHSIFNDLVFKNYLIKYSVKIGQVVMIVIFHLSKSYGQHEPISEKMFFCYVIWKFNTLSSDWKIHKAFFFLWKVFSTFTRKFCSKFHLVLDYKMFSFYFHLNVILYSEIRDGFRARKLCIYDIYIYIYIYIYKLHVKII